MPAIKVSSRFNYYLLGSENSHFFVGYYDINPVSSNGEHILCHRVERKYTSFIEPAIAEIGLLSIKDNKFAKLTNSNAMNWQLGSRVQWIDDNTIIFNDVVKGMQKSVKFDIDTKEKIMVYDRPFWSISTNKKYGASLNFSRIKVMRPGYGYDGNNIDNDKETLVVFDLDSGGLIYEIELDEIIQKVDCIIPEDKDIYLNHIAWSPCGMRFITIFHYEDKSKRMIFPVLIDIEAKSVDLIFSDGYFSHHTFIDKNRILAYLKLDKEYCFAMWSKAQGWIQIKDSMPKLDGHPTYINNKVLVDSYPNRLGIMSLYLGSISNDDKLDRIAYIVNNPKYEGPLRCDLHPRASEKHNLIVCDIPYKNCRKILIIKGALNG